MSQIPTGAGARVGLSIGCLGAAWGQLNRFTVLTTIQKVLPHGT